MKKVIMVAVLGLVVSVFGAKYDKKTVTGAAGSLSVSLTNANSTVAYVIEDAYVSLASNATAAATVTLSDGAVFCDSATVVSNGASCVIDVDARVLLQEAGDVATVTRDANAGTNGAWAVIFVINNQ